MKICPLCRQLYDDETYNFCLTDGSVLESDKNPELTELLQKRDITPDSDVTELATRIRLNLNPLEKTVGVSLSYILADLNQELLKAKFNEKEFETAFQIAGVILIKGLQAIARQSDPGQLSENLRQAVKSAEVLAESNRISGKNKNKIFQLALTSYPDRNIAEMIAEALTKVGVSDIDSEAALIIEPGDAETVLEFVPGIIFDRGYFKPEFENEFDPPPVFIDYPNILLIDGKLTRGGDLSSIIRKLGQSLNPNLLIIAEDADESVLNATIPQETKGKPLKIVVVKSPGFGDRRRAMLKDIAILTGTAVFGEGNLATIGISELGRAGKAVVTRDSTRIIGAGGNAGAAAARIAEIKREIETTNSDYDREKFIERLDGLTGGAAVIRVGGRSEFERREKLESVKRVLRDCLWGLTSGYVAGNNLTLINAANRLRQQGAAATNMPRREVNLILAAALEMPFEEMINVQGKGRSPSEILQRVRARQKENNNSNIGYDVEKDEITDLVKAGIIIPRMLVTRICDAAVYVAARKLATFRRTDEIMREMNN